MDMRVVEGTERRAVEVLEIVPGWDPAVPDDVRGRERPDELRRVNNSE